MNSLPTIITKQFNGAIALLSIPTANELTVAPFNTKTRPILNYIFAGAMKLSN